MRALMMLAVLVLPLDSAAQQHGQPAASTAPALVKADYVLCLAHMERASQKAMLNQDFREDATKAMACDIDRMSTLTTEQLVQYVEVGKMFLVQLKAPSAIAHLQVAQESQKYLMMLR